MHQLRVFTAGASFIAQVVYTQGFCWLLLLFILFFLIFSVHLVFLVFKLAVLLAIVIRHFSLSLFFVVNLYHFLAIVSISLSLFFIFLFFFLLSVLKYSFNTYLTTQCNQFSIQVKNKPY